MPLALYSDCYYQREARDGLGFDYPYSEGVKISAQTSEKITLNRGTIPPDISDPYDVNNTKISVPFVLKIIIYSYAKP